MLINLSCAGANQESPVPSTYIEQYNEKNISKETERGYNQKQNTYVNKKRTKGEGSSKSSRNTRQQDEASSLYLV